MQRLEKQQCQKSALLSPSRSNNVADINEVILMNKSLKFILIIICIVVVVVTNASALYIGPTVKTTTVNNHNELNLSELPNTNTYYVVDKYRWYDSYYEESGSRIVVYNPQTYDIKEFKIDLLTYYKVIVGKTSGYNIDNTPCFMCRNDDKFIITEG